MEDKKPRPPFGEIAIQKGFVSKDQIKRALEIQSEEDMQGKKHRPVGRILLDIGWITDAQIYQVLGAMHKAGIRQPRAKSIS